MKGGNAGDENAYLFWEFDAIYGNVNVSVNFLNASGDSVFKQTLSNHNGTSRQWPAKPVEHQAVTCSTTFLPSSRCSHCNISGQWTSNVAQGTRRYFLARDAFGRTNRRAIVL